MRAQGPAARPFSSHGCSGLKAGSTPPTSARRLSRSSTSAPGARGCRNVRITDKPDREAPYEGVLVDAPCSGSGTWRRAPHLKWSTSPADVAAHAARQQALLAHFAGLVRPGGLLVYATCSLSRMENEAAVATFLATHRDFAPAGFAPPFAAAAGAAGLTILPAQHDTDGFFVAALRRAL